MKVSPEWLQKYLSRTMSAKAMAEALERAGIEIEQIIDSAKLDKKIVTAKVKKIVQHPQASKLKIAEVTTGRSSQQVVCGAQNLEPGQIVPLVLPGAYLPDGKRIDEAEIRGIKSAGMIASPAELNLGDDQEGIMVLDSDTKPGEPLANLIGPVSIFDVSTHANRPDLLSIIGLAREVAAQTGATLKLPDASYTEAAAKVPIIIKATDQVRRYAVAKLEIDNNRPSPDWLKRRLIATGIRPINLVVDVTNYVMAEFGQPLHAFDAKKIKLPLEVRLAASGEKLRTLDGVDRQLTTADLVIADGRGAVALAGVMGGETAEVRPDTTTVLLESASFDAVTVRKAALRYGIRTESSARFERSLPVQLAPLGLARAIELLTDLALGRVTGLADHLEVWPWIQHIGARPSKLTKLLGVAVSAETVVKSLRQLGFEAETFNIAEQAKKRLGKPYVWGASFKKNGDQAFDCSYLIDRLYSLIGVWVGHTSLAQYEVGRPVELTELRPGDVLFYEGADTSGRRDFKLDEIQSENSKRQPRTVLGHYYRYNDQTKTYTKIKSRYQGLVGHNGIYIGDGQVVDARHFEWRDDRWQVLPSAKQSVQVVPLAAYTQNPGFLGARRYIEDLTDYVTVTVPWWRPDIKLEEDVAEEVIRMIGYDQVPTTLPQWRPVNIAVNRYWPRLWQVKAVLRALGLFEVTTYSFVSESQLTGFGEDPKQHLKLRNPRSIEQAYLRSRLGPSLLTAVAVNQDYGSQFGLYEVSSVFTKSGTQDLPAEPTHLGVMVWSADHAYRQVKAALEALADEFKLDLKIDPSPLKMFHPAVSAKVMADRYQLGSIGTIHPGILDQFKVKSGTVGYLEIDLGALLAQSRIPEYQPISKFPPVYRDIAVIIPQSVSWDQVREQIVGSKLANPHFLSEYFGTELGKGVKSLAVRLEMVSLDHTLNDPAAQDRLSRITALLAKKFGAKLRT